MQQAAAFAAAGARVVLVPARAERCADLPGSCATLDEARALGATSCVIATNTGRHADDARAALALGFDVLVEKPLASDAASAGRIVAAAAGRRAFTGCVLRFSAALGAFRELLPRLGRVAEVEVECRSYLPDWRPARPYRESYSASAAEGGVLRDLIHEVDYAGWLFGWPSMVEGTLANSGALGIEADESADLAWRAPSGCRVTLRLDYLTKPTSRRVVARGDGGALECDLAAQTVTFQGETRPFPETAADRFLAQARAFLSGAADDRLATAAEGERAVQLCDAARRSSVSGRQEAVA